MLRVSQLGPDAWKEGPKSTIVTEATKIGKYFRLHIRSRPMTSLAATSSHPHARCVLTQVCDFNAFSTVAPVEFMYLFFSESPYDLKLGS